MAKPLSCAAVLLCFMTGQLKPLFAYITIDTNELAGLTNSVNYTNDESITNLPAKTVPEPVYPNSYLSTGKIEVEVPETPQRRLDLVFWIAMPAIYYLTSTIMYLKNQYIYNTITVDISDNNYMYFNTFMIPITTAYFDYLYMQEQDSIKQKYAGRSSGQNPDLCLNIPLLYFEF
jgi:hypothetical protein